MEQDLSETLHSPDPLSQAVAFTTGWHLILGKYYKKHILNLLLESKKTMRLCNLSCDEVFSRYRNVDVIYDANNMLSAHNTEAAGLSMRNSPDFLNS